MCDLLERPNRGGQRRIARPDGKIPLERATRRIRLRIGGLSRSLATLAAGRRDARSQAVSASGRMHQGHSIGAAPRRGPALAMRPDLASTRAAAAPRAVARPLSDKPATLGRVGYVASSAEVPDAADCSGSPDRVASKRADCHSPARAVVHAGGRVAAELERQHEYRIEARWLLLRYARIPEQERSRAAVWCLEMLTTSSERQTAASPTKSGSLPTPRPSSQARRSHRRCGARSYTPSSNRRCRRPGPESGTGVVYRRCRSR